MTELVKFSGASSAVEDTETVPTPKVAMHVITFPVNKGGTFVTDRPCALSFRNEVCGLRNNSDFATTINMLGNFRVEGPKT